jgi:CBS domain-containing protein
MKVRDIMTTEVATAAPDTTLEEIATMMRDENVGSIPIVEDEELTGIVTDRDIVVRCIAEGKDPSEVTAEEVYSEELQTVEPDADVRQAADIMGRRQIRRLPVVDDGELVGIVALGDIAVKERGDAQSAEALEEISEGVKGGRKGAQSAGTRGRQKSRGRGGERAFEEEEESEMSESRSSTRRMATAEETGSRGNVRTQARNPGGSRVRDKRVARGEAGSPRGRAGAAPSGREGQLAGTRGTGRTGQAGGRSGQGITNRAASREADRQQRVSPKRAQAERGGKSKRRAG